MIDILNKYNVDKKKLIGIGIFIILFLIALPLTLIQVQKQQEIRQRAEGLNNVYLELKPSREGKNTIDTQFVQTLYLHNPLNKDISAVDISLAYNTDNLDIVDFITEKDLSYIVKDINIPGEIHLVGINSRQTHIVDSSVPLGAFIFKAKKESNGTIDFPKVTITVTGETEPLAINPSDNKRGTYTVSEPTPTTATISPAVSPITVASPVSPTISQIPTPPSILELPKVQITLNKSIYVAGDQLVASAKVSPNINGYVYINSFVSNEPNEEISGNFNEFSVAVACSQEKECIADATIPVPEQGTLNVFGRIYLKDLNGLYKQPGFLLEKNKETEIYGKKVEVLEINLSTDYKTKDSVAIRVGNSKFNMHWDNKYYVREGLAVSLASFTENDSFINVGINEVMTIPIRHFSATTNPQSGSPGSLFTINTKTEINSDVKAILNGPGINTESVTLYDDGIHGDGSVGDGVYGYVFRSPDSQIGIYTVDFTFDNQPLSIKTSVRTNYFDNECIPFTNLNGNLYNKINIVVVPDNYSENELDLFQSEVLPRHANFLLSKEPYLSNKDKINIWFIKKSSSIDCSYGKWNYCIPAVEEIISQTCPFADKAIVLGKNNSRGYGSTGGKTAVVNAASVLGSEGITLHEFGHTMGMLYDEYQDLPTRLSDTSSANCDVFACPKWCSGKSSFAEPQCSKSTDEQSCKNQSYNEVNCAWFSKVGKCDYPYFSDINFGQACTQDTVCLYGCGGRNGYRSSNYSIMGDTNSSKVREYNTVSKIQIQKMINSLWEQKNN